MTCAAGICTAMSAVSDVYAHSAALLVRLDPATSGVSTVGSFDACGSVFDIALDEGANLYGVSDTGLYKIDAKTAHCTLIAGGSYPTSLSFVPKGMLDPKAEVLVGYQGADYIRIDPATGAKTKLGTISVPGSAIGDLVWVTAGKMYATLSGSAGCTANDCLIEVDPTNGKVLKNLGALPYHNVVGLSYSGGKLYGFSDASAVFEFTLSTLVAKSIPISGAAAGLSYAGAGSSTSSP
jgi:hypothetical protein